MDNAMIRRAAGGARRHKLDGWGDGSAYRNHPCWVRRGPFVFVDHWTTSNKTTVYLLTEPTTTIKAGCNDSWGNGCPLPVPADGNLIAIFAWGKWQIEGPWQEVCDRALAQVLDEVDAAKAKLVEARKQAQREAQAAKIHYEQALRNHYQQLA